MHFVDNVLSAKTTLFLLLVVSFEISMNPFILSRRQSGEDLGVKFHPCYNFLGTLYEGG